MEKNPFILNTPDTDAFMTKINMKKQTFKFLFLLTFLLPYIVNAQVFYPPNFSFEDDTNQMSIQPWQITGNYYLPTSINTNLPTNGEVFINFESLKLNDTIKNTKLYQNFPLDLKPRFLKFESIFSGPEISQFNVKLKLTGMDMNNKRVVICELDTLMDTISNYKFEWVYQSIDLSKYYKLNFKPDSCYIEFNCDIIHLIPMDVSQMLFLDNIRFESEFSDIESVQKYDNLLVCYPNPNNGQLTVKYQGNQTIQFIEIVDVNGRTVYQIDVNSNESIHDVSLLPNGIYTIKVRLNSNEILSEKISIQ